MTSSTPTAAFPHADDLVPLGHVPEALRHARAWPYEEAMRLLERIHAERAAGHGKHAARGQEVLFETGYGPSGLPHIGTFGEVARTSWVRRAFASLAPGMRTRLLAFSDDMDGLRKVPDNVPNKEMLAQHLGKPLTSIPDPFGTHESFGHHNNARLRAFLDGFGFAYEFASSTDYYRSGRFDAALCRVLETYDEILAVILPTLGPERRATYSPFLPVCARTGRVMQVPILERKHDAASIVWKDEETGQLVETPVTGGRCKLQWKADWAMRWFALGVDYEMSGKDLIDSVKLSSRICRILGGVPPENLTYELFLDEKGEKISKSKGNGLSVEEWLTYGPPESLALFMYHAPKRAKRLYFDVIPRMTDEYLSHLAKLPGQDEAGRLGNPAWHIHAGDVPRNDSPVTFGVLLNLATVANAEDKAILWGYLNRYAPGTTPAGAPLLDRLMEYAIAYYRDFVKPQKRYRAATPEERVAFEDLIRRLRENKAALGALGVDARAAAVQDLIYDAGRRPPFMQKQKDGTNGVSIEWFNAIYQVLLGEERGPRFGSFVALYGVEETAALIEAALKRPPAADDQGRVSA
ncbi:MAG: lysine--tRNA ligase [Alphaproteobacteria bacterium]|nr:lysine--tRNA ligase [Alphaproteobacteria bacterium]